MKYSQMSIECFLIFELFAAMWTAETNVLHVFHNAPDTCIVFGYDLCLVVGLLEIFQTLDLLLRNSSVALRRFEFQAESVVSLVSVRNYQIGLTARVSFAPCLESFVA